MLSYEIILSRSQWLKQVTCPKVVLLLLLYMEKGHSVGSKGPARRHLFHAVPWGVPVADIELLSICTLYCQYKSNRLQ